MPWKSNTDSICKKVSSGIYVLKRLQDFVDQNTIQSVYNAIVQSHFNYCCEVWNIFGETQSTRLQKLHNRAARVIANVPVLSMLELEPLKEQRIKTEAKTMFKILNYTLFA